MGRKRMWCDVCRGADELFGCSGCQRRFHTECLGLKVTPCKGWICDECEDGDNTMTDGEKTLKKSHLKRTMHLHSLRRKMQVTLQCCFCNVEGFEQLEQRPSFRV